MNNLKQYFLLRDDITYLNYGSFGACARPVFERYQQFQRELEQEPVEFITVNGLQYLEQSREALGRYIHCDKDELVFVTNPTYAVNCIAKNLKLQSGDEILTTSLEYGACDKTWEYYCQRNDVRYIKQPVRFPLRNKEDFVEQFFKGLTARTKLVFISHITSTTALKLPVEEICAIAKQKGLLTFIDGAHAPGQWPVNLQTLQADFYTGACHKWMMAPKGCSFLYAKKELQEGLDPLIISWGYKALFPSPSQFLDYHQMNGTRDYSAFLTIPSILTFMQEQNWPDVTSRCRKLVKDYAPELCDLLKTESLAPLTDDFILQMFSARLKTKEPEKLYELFFSKYRIEIPVMRHGEEVFLRYSIHAFNDRQDLDKLSAALKDIMAHTNLIEL